MAVLPLAGAFDVDVDGQRLALAGRASVWLGITGAVVGFFAVPVVGLPLGGVLGIYVGEHLRTRDPAAAWAATRATITGFGVAVVVQLAAALAMIAVWVVWVIVG